MLVHNRHTPVGLVFVMFEERYGRVGEYGEVQFSWMGGIILRSELCAVEDISTYKTLERLW